MDPWRPPGRFFCCLKSGPHKNPGNLGRKDPRARQEAMAGLGYSIVGAVLLFGTWFIISLAAGFLNSGG